MLNKQTINHLHSLPMHIRLAKQEDYDLLVDIWLEASIAAHKFIDPSFWVHKVQDMKQLYFPASINWIMEDQQSQIIGFASMIDAHLAALFISNNQQSKGLGSQLLNFLKSKHQHISLNVYALNHQAIQFYQKHEFILTEEAIDAETGALDYFMHWNKK